MSRTATRDGVWRNWAHRGAEACRQAGVWVGVGPGEHRAWAQSLQHMVQVALRVSGVFPDQGSNPSPALAGRFFSTGPPGKSSFSFKTVVPGVSWGPACLGGSRLSVPLTFSAPKFHFPIFRLRQLSSYDLAGKLRLKITCPKLTKAI